MISKEQVIATFARNLGMVKQQTAGLTHEDSLLQPPFRGNCLNWVLGHLAENRNSLLEALGQPPIMTKAQAGRYGYGSEPVVCHGADILRMEDLLAMLERTQEGIAAGITQITPAELAKEVHFAARDMTIAERIFFQLWHETYHVGQTELLRQLAGTNDKVI